MPHNGMYTPGSAYQAQRRWIQPHTVRCLELAIETLGMPDSLLDVGCGEGALVLWARAKGIDATGVDLSVPDGDEALLRADLCDPLRLERVFDWVLCWEVAEHLREKSAGTLCDTLVAHLQRPAGRLLFTAAPPGQRGPGHINTQPMEYWRELLEVRGLVWQVKESMGLADRWVTQVRRAPWYGKNLAVFAWA